MNNNDCFTNKCDSKAKEPNCINSSKNPEKYQEKEMDAEAIRQQARYSINNEPAPDNNIFFEGRSNPLSSKGN